ncbi:Traf2 and NCK-interacting protein kinase [Dissostichus eleginoides]|uniref:non-specific serine/threonine protein kinase n=1 Tax=Dissostichus eleginoides TaxID=100907 RepID=A0AAD9C4J2_DISEL|nr:Traf2 and NCK-interacting protein kinase [Dissostichus eleginoides]
MEQLRREEERRHAEREQEYIRRQLEEEQRQLEILQQQLLQEQALLMEYKRKQVEEQRQAERLQRQLQQERAYLVSLQQQQQQEGRQAEKKPLYHYKDISNPTDKPAWAKEVLKQQHVQGHPPHSQLRQQQSFNQPASSPDSWRQNRAQAPRRTLSHGAQPLFSHPPHIHISLDGEPLDPGLKQEISQQVREFRAQKLRGRSPGRSWEQSQGPGQGPSHGPVSQSNQVFNPYALAPNNQNERPRDRPLSAPNHADIQGLIIEVDIESESQGRWLKESRPAHSHTNLLVPPDWEVSHGKTDRLSYSFPDNALQSALQRLVVQRNVYPLLLPVEERSKLNRQSSPALQPKVTNRISDPSLPPRSESFSSGGMQPARTPPIPRSIEPQMAHLVPVKTHSGSMSGSQSLQDQTGSALSEGVSVSGSPRPEMPRQNSDPTSDTPGPPQRIAEEDMPPKVPQRTTSISPALVRKHSPNGGGVGLGPRTGSQLIRASNPDLRRSELSLDAMLQRTSSNSSSSSSPSSQGGSAERRGQAKPEGSPPGANQEAKPKQEEGRESARPSRPADLSALAKELRELRVEEGSRPPVKVTDYSSSSDDSDSSDDDGQTVGHDGTVAVSDIPRIMPAVQSSSESYGGLTEDSLGDAYNSSKDSTLVMREAEERRRGGHTESNGFGNHGNHGNLPDLVQQSNSPSATPTSALQELGDMAEFGLGGSKSSFTPFVDPRVYQTSPGENDDDENSTEDMFSSELLRQEQARLNEARKISVVNVNPTNIRPHSDTPEIRKYKKRFNSEILCAALWENGLMLLDRSGQGKVYNLITRRRFLQMDVLEGLNVLVTISGKKNKLRVYYLSWLRNRILHNDPEVEKKQGWITVGELEGCVHYKVVKYERIKFLVIAQKNAVEIYAWAPKPYHKFMAFKSFTELQHRPQLVDLTVEEGQRLKVIYGSSVGFHVIDVDSGNPYDIYIPSHCAKQMKIQSQVTPHSIVVLPKTDGMEMLLCYEDEGVYVNTYGRITKDVVLQWGEMPTSVAYIHSNQIMGWGEKAIEIRSVETGHLDGVFFASVRSGGSSQVFFMTLNRNTMMNW